MNYKVIFNEEKLDEFIEWLPETKDSEGFYIQLFGRKKYGDIKIQSGQQSLSRFVCKKDRIKYKLRQLETPLGTYMNREVILPQECLALYIIPNPRCYEKAAKQLIKVLADKITKPYEHYNTYQLAITELHKSSVNNYFLDFDFDDVDFYDIKDTILSFVNKEALTVIKTRGGFHLLIRLDSVNEQYKKTWYKNIVSLGPDVRGTNVMLPCVGCVQGNFVPHFLEI